MCDAAKNVRDLLSRESGQMLSKKVRQATWLRMELVWNITHGAYSLLVHIPPAMDSPVALPKYENKRTTAVTLARCLCATEIWLATCETWRTMPDPKPATTIVGIEESFYVGLIWVIGIPWAKTRSPTFSGDLRKRSIRLGVTVSRAEINHKNKWGHP